MTAESHKPSKPLLLLAGIAAGAALLLHPAAAIAQAWPAKAVRIVTPYPPGGGGDLFTRLLAPRLNQAWGQAVVVDNKAGAATIIGTDSVAKAEPDGYTLLITSDSSITANPHLFPKLPYDPLKDLAAVTLLFGANMLLVVHPSVNAKTVAELVALAKAQPGKLNYSSFGSGSQPHLAIEALNKEAGISINHVPYKGLGPGLAAVIAGEVQVSMAGAAASVGQIKAGKLRALATTRAVPLLAGIVTLKDAGYPNIDPQAWFGLFAPGATPPALLNRIQRDVAQIMNEPAFLEKELISRGYTPGGSTPAEFAAFIREDYEYKRRLIQVSGAKAE